MHQLNGPVVVTGAGGFIGSAVVEALVECGAEVRAISGPPGEVTRRMPPLVTSIAYDLTSDSDELQRFIKGSRCVIHLAGPPSVADSLERPAAFASAHVVGTANVLEACRRSGVHDVVFVSSAEVYGSPEVNPVTEDHSLHPRSPYGAAKLGAEAMMRAFGASFDIAGYILRPFSIYGRHMNPRSLIAQLLSQFESTDDILVNDLRPVRDYCAVHDVASAVVAACRNPATSIRTLNVGTGVGSSIPEIVEALAQISGRPLTVREREGARRPHAMETLTLVADVTQIEATLGWRARLDLRSGLSRALDELAEVR